MHDQEDSTSVFDEFKSEAVSLVNDQGFRIRGRPASKVELSVIDRWCRRHRQQVYAAATRSAVTRPTA